MSSGEAPGTSIATVVGPSPTAGARPFVRRHRKGGSSGA